MVTYMVTYAARARALDSHMASNAKATLRNRRPLPAVYAARARAKQPNPA